MSEPVVASVAIASNGMLGTFAWRQQAPKEERYVEGGWRCPGKHPAATTFKIVDAQRGIVEITPRRRKVAIVGFAESSRDQAPQDDPEWEVWGLNQLYRYLGRFDRWFEIHNRPMFEADMVRDTNYVAWLQQSPVPVYMIDVFPDMPNSVRFPLEACANLGGRDYFTSSIAYMFALALLEGFEEIGIWGVDLIVGEEYTNQKPCLEWWIGFAEGRGVKVFVPPQSALMKQWVRYGYPQPRTTGLHSDWLIKRLHAYQEKRNELITALNQMDGAIAELGNLATVAENHEKGVDLQPPVPGQK